MDALIRVELRRSASHGDENRERHAKNKLEDIPHTFPIAERRKSSLKLKWCGALLSLQTEFRKISQVLCYLLLDFDVALVRPNIDEKMHVAITLHVRMVILYLTYKINVERFFTVVLRSVRNVTFEGKWDYLSRICVEKHLFVSKISKMNNTDAGCTEMTFMNVTPRSSKRFARHSTCVRPAWEMKKRNFWFTKHR